VRLPFHRNSGISLLCPGSVPELVSLVGFLVVLTCISVSFALYVRLLIQTHATRVLSMNTGNWCYSEFLPQIMNHLYIILVQNGKHGQLPSKLRNAG
jgi:hypothetical protein